MSGAENTNWMRRRVVVLLACGIAACAAPRLASARVHSGGGARAIAVQHGDIPLEWPAGVPKAGATLTAIEASLTFPRTVTSQTFVVFSPVI